MNIIFYKRYALFFLRCMTCVFFLPMQTRALVKVAFIEFRTPQKQTVAVELGGRFSHVAISYGNLWLHAYPGRRVELISTPQLLRLGYRVEFKTLINRRDLVYAEIAPYLGKDYDFEFDWSNDKIYCSELVAKILKISPRPMNFNAPYWKPYYHRKNGLPGMSPDFIYSILR